MTNIQHRFDVELTIERCYECGRVYAHESNRQWEFRGQVSCPCCAQRIKTAHFKKIEELERTVAALKGALTKARRRK